MRTYITRKMQESLLPNEAFLIFDKDINLYIYGSEHIDVSLILPQSIYLISTMNISVELDKKVIPIITNNVINTVHSIVKRLKVQRLTGDANHIPASLYLKTKNIFHNKNMCIIEKNPLDNDIMKINSILLKQIITEYVNRIDKEHTYMQNKSIFESLSFSYDITDAFFSMSKSKGNIKAYEKFEDNILYFIDCGIKYKGLYSDFTFGVKFSPLTTTEKYYLNNIEQIQKYICNKISKVTNPKKVIEDLYKTNIEIDSLNLGFGHSVGIYIHENFSIYEGEERYFTDNMIFTLEPLYTPLISETQHMFRLESTYGHFDNNIINYFEKYPNIYIL